MATCLPLVDTIEERTRSSSWVRGLVPALHCTCILGAILGESYPILRAVSGCIVSRAHLIHTIPSSLFLNLFLIPPPFSYTDVARFKYPPYWVSVERMFDSMLASDRVSGKARGFCVLSPLPDICASPTSMRLRTVSVNPSAASSQQTPSFPVLASSTPNPTMSSSSTSTSTSTATSPFSHEFSVGSQPASGPASVLGDLEAEASRGIRVPCTAPSFDAPPAAAATSQLSAGASSLSPLSSSVPATASSPVPSPSSSSRTVVTGVDGKKRVLVCAQPTDHSHLSSMSEPMCDSNMNNGSSNQRSAFTIDNITTSTSLSSSPSSSPAAALTQLPTSVPSTGKSCPARIRSWFMTVNKYGRDRT